jgi:SAM-dependent methyltransferase
LETVAALLKHQKTGRLLDLACGHGAFSILAQKLGWDVTAVDVRTQRMPPVEGINWIESDVREFPIAPGDYDCIALLGLLYHLELKDVLDLLRRCSHTPTIVDTHVSLAPTHDELGYRGELFDELAGRTPEQHAASGTASWKNLVSFWPDEDSLLRMFSDCGYGSVLKLSPSYRDDRTFYLCLPPSGADLDVTIPAPQAQPQPQKKSWLRRRAKKAR